MINYKKKQCCFLSANNDVTIYDKDWRNARPEDGTRLNGQIQWICLNIKSMNRIKQ